MSTHTHSDTKPDPKNDAETLKKMTWMAPILIIITAVLLYVMWKNPTHYTPKEVGDVAEKIFSLFYRLIKTIDLAGNTSAFSFT